ncbi:MAG: DUF4097 family beta strand repeat protein [Chloroflexota bacterium]|nr:DUF4097 family beta strand repeat protein [Chloroflexota bacterium]MDE3193514.1 DUF4097 family beta strand repeat protein [Chloroflexota bacterium]
MSDDYEAERVAREAERAAGQAEHGAERESRQAEREARHAERAARREEWRQRRGPRWSWGGFLGETLGERIREEIRQGMTGAAGEPGPGAEDTVEHRFSVSGMPRVTVKNVSGETSVRVGDAGEVVVHARKRVTGWSEERSRRLLENVEIRFEQKDDEILIEPRLFEQERGWLELFRGGRVAVDLDVRVPRESDIDATTVSGELSVAGTRGPLELRSVSGEISAEDVQGPMRVRSVSGDVCVAAYAGQLEANTVSGEVTFERSRVRAPDVVTVSGDVDIDAVVTPHDGPEGRLKTVSGDVEICLADADVEVDFHTTSGDAEVEGPARVEREGRRDRRIVVGTGTGHLRVRTVSGDLCCRCSDEPASPPASSAAEEPIGAAPSATRPRPETARDVLARVARGELSVDEAAAALDAARGGNEERG